MVKAAYIHIPFCEQICHYCDFNKVFLRRQPVDDYIEALLLEIERTFFQHHSDAIKTVYIGGGTPTALSLKQLEKLLKGLTNVFPIERVEEFTIEVNPDNIDDEKLSVLKTYGVNRLSVGVQTFDDELLREIGRTHSKASILDALERCSKRFDNISIDLMFALPKQTVLHFENSLNEALSLPITHVSAYALQLEAKTVFYNRYKKGELVLPSDDEAAAMYELLRSKMSAAGFMHYEISNFAKRGYESKHNLVYWNNEEYFGFGAGAHGYVGRVRYENYHPVKKYIQALFRNERPVLREHVVSEWESIEEAIFLGLRKVSGIDKEDFFRRYGRRLEQLFPQQLNKLKEAGLLYVDDEVIRLTEEALLLGDEIFAEFIGVFPDD